MISHDLSKLSLSQDGGNLQLTEVGNGAASSTRLASMTQRVMERQTVTTSSESRVEKKSQQHSYRLE